MPKCRINLYDICHTLELGPPAHWRQILLIHDFSLVIGGKLHNVYFGFSLLVANYSRNILFFLHWQPGSGCKHIPYVH